MGYFNFYLIKKFLKSFLYNKRMKKILLFIFILLIIFLLFEKVFAYNFEYNGISLVASDTMKNGNSYTYNLLIISYSENVSAGVNITCDKLASNSPFYLKYRNSNSQDRAVNIVSDNNATIYRDQARIFYRPNGTTTFNNSISNSTTTVTQLSSSYNTIQNVQNSILYCDFDLYFKDNSNNMVPIYSTFQEPSITTSSLNITDWDFTTLDIDLGSVTTPELDIIQITYNDVSNLLGVSNYYTSGSSVIHIPIQDLNNLIVFTDEGTFNVQYYDKVSLNTSTIDRYQLGLYNISITTEKADLLNEQATRDIRNDMYNQQVITNENLTNINETQQETNEKLDEIKDTITDDTVESSAEDLPSIDVGDPSQDGIDNIFQSIYNAFCTGQAQDIVFPIPFTNKNITLNPYYVRDMLNNNGAGWVYNLIQAFWGYLIGRYIVSDISKKITKVKSGNIENLENENIKEEML